MNAPAEAAEELLSKVETIGHTIARPAAADVDLRGRFPQETLQALRDAQLLSAAVPTAYGGDGASLYELTRHCIALGRHCASSAMMLAMHHIEVLCIARHAQAQPQLIEYLEQVVKEQRLIASVTSEVGPSGDMRRSVAAVARDGQRFSLDKQATTISYGAYADDLLVTARSSADAAANEQVLVLLLRGGFSLRDQGHWDTLGMRGTCSAGATVNGHGDSWQILPQAFDAIASRTMVPSSHALWSGVWLGIASDAVGNVRAMVRQKARKEPGVVSESARRLASVVVKLDLFQHQLFTIAREVDALWAQNDTQTLDGMSFAMRVNNLKLAASTLVVEIVSEAMSIGGIATYKNDSPFSLGRHLRDAHSAALMVNNDRLRETNAAMLMVKKGD